MIRDSVITHEYLFESDWEQQFLLVARLGMHIVKLAFRILVVVKNTWRFTDCFVSHFLSFRIGGCVSHWEWRVKRMGCQSLMCVLLMSINWIRGLLWMCVLRLWIKWGRRNDVFFNIGGVVNLSVRIIFYFLQNTKLMVIKVPCAQSLFKNTVNVAD